MASTKLARGTFSGESASGWQTVRFATPYAIAADHYQEFRARYLAASTIR